MDELCLGSLAVQVSETFRAPADAVTLRSEPHGADGRDEAILTVTALEAVQ